MILLMAQRSGFTLMWIKHQMYDGDALRQKEIFVAFYASAEIDLPAARLAVAAQCS